jgi:hypothetical protein
MKKLTIGLVFASVLFSVPANAQLANKNYTINLSVDDITVISDALQLAPMGKAFPVLNKMREQVLAQQPKPEPASKVEPAKPEVKNVKPATAAPAK